MFCSLDKYYSNGQLLGTVLQLVNLIGIMILTVHDVELIVDHLSESTDGGGGHSNKGDFINLFSSR